MDDLAGLDWAASNSQTAKKAPPMNSPSAFAALRPTPPVSGRSTPATGVTSSVSSKPGTPSNDSFSNLVAFNSSTSNKSLSLQEQQKRLLQQKREQEIAQKKLLNAQYKGDDEHFWNNLGSGRSTPVPGLSPGGNAPKKSQASFANGYTGNEADDDEDFLAAFNSQAPIVSTTVSSSSVAKINGLSPAPVQASLSAARASAKADEHGSSFADDEDDDPFGLKHMKLSSASHHQTAPSQLDDDDVLGLLSKPVSEIQRPETKITPDHFEYGSVAESDPQDRAIAELVDMGFPAEKSRQALETTVTKADVAGAVSWLLQQAHAEARQQVETRRRSIESSRDYNDRVNGQGSRNARSGRSPVEESERRQDPRRQRKGDPPTAVEKDPTQLAAEFGNNFLKTAGSLWKTGTKRVQQAVQEFNSDSDTSQPRWMRDPANEPTSNASKGTDHEDVMAARRRRTSASKKAELVTDEAKMLESDQGRPPPKKPARSRQESRLDSSTDNSRDHSPAIPSRLRDRVNTPPANPRQQHSPVPIATRASLSRQAIEEQAAQAYVSSARRRKPASQLPVSASEPDLLEVGSQSSVPSRPSTTEPARLSKSAAVLSVRPAPPKRIVPTVSPVTLNASNRCREEGNAHYKRGDYAAAHQSYTAAISHLPKTHPIVIVLLINHSLTALKIGEPRTAILDADTAIDVIGVSKGESESVDLKNGEPAKSMRDFYGKALVRKAEALEQVEKWTEAAAVWKEAVEGGHGGASSIQARTRAEKAANPQAPKSKSASPSRPTSDSKHSVMNKLAGRPAKPTANSTAAVNRLRAANAAAEKADDEKFALGESIDARLTAWKSGKADNLRALLSSLDSVLWPEAQWKKIGMAELVLPNKVKIQYMKGIAKVHPDKIPTTATTEQRMIAGGVFSTLNEAWDKFKAENSL